MEADGMGCMMQPIDVSLGCQDGATRQERNPKMTMQETLAGYFGEDNVRAYSGRAMYGKECIGVEADSLSVFMEYLGEAIEDLAERGRGDVLQELGQMLRNTKTDSMGTGVIVYFPDVAFEV